MKVCEAVANAFVKEGATTVFGLLGDGNLSWVAAMSRHPAVRLIDARDEGAALLMAEGWARATGEVGVCNVTQGPGLTRMTTSLVTATRSRSPVVVYTSKTHFNDERVNQAINQERLVSATGAGYIEVLAPGFAEDAVRQAFYQARIKSRPVVLCYPLDIQDRDCDADDDYQPSSTLFPGQQRIRPAQDRLDEAARIIAGSRKPVVLVGRGAVRSGAVAASERLAKRIGALIATTLVAKGTLAGAEYHAGIAGLFSTRTVMQLFDEADCVIAIGASLNPHTLEGGLLFPNARIVHIDVARTILMGNDKLADCYVQGDAEITTRALEEMLADQRVSGEGFRTPAVRRALLNADRDSAEYEIEPGTVDPREASRVIDEHLPAEVGVVIGVGHSFAFPVMTMKRPRALHEFVNGFGCIGETLPVAIGMGVAQGGKPLALIEGDGGAMQNIQELDTASRLGIKLLFIILNDEGLGAEYQKARAKGFDPNLAVVRSPDFGAVARGFGCRGRVARTIEEVAAGIDEFMAGDGPMALDVRISRNVIAITYRRLHYGEDA
ncbi:MAG: thiamine pyrophosphate-binding protein [Betaproteobacteria bacterium]|nr:thiamine pyrophosphate-binding protein [Betaproteobacteria bacterium]